MKAFLLAGLSAVILGACASTQPPSARRNPEAILAESVTYRILSTEEILASEPKLAPGGDAKAYVASYLDWLAAPGHLMERSAMFTGGPPPGLPDDVDFEAILMALASEGHTAAMLMNEGDDIDSLVGLADKGDPTAKLAIEMTNISVGSLQQKVDALAWFRSQAPTNKDAAFALGTTLLSQASGGDGMDGMMGAFGGAATPGEVREGAAMLVEVARAAPLDVMVQIGTLMSMHAGVDAAVDKHARNILELVVSSTKAEAVPQPDFSSLEDPDVYARYDAQMTELSGAVESRIGLAGMLRAGLGGDADVERAKTLYREALVAAQDYRAYQALAAMGVDVSEYDSLFLGPPDGGEDWWDLEPEGDVPDAPEPAPAPN